MRLDLGLYFCVCTNFCVLFVLLETLSVERVLAGVKQKYLASPFPYLDSSEKVEKKITYNNFTGLIHDA